MLGFCKLSHICSSMHIKQLQLYVAFSLYTITIYEALIQVHLACTHTHRNTHTDIDTDIRTDRQTDTHTQAHTDTDTHRQTYIHKYTFTAAETFRPDEAPTKKPSS